MNKDIKKFGTGILAAAFGLAIVFIGAAFKADHAKTNTYTFYYSGPSFSKTDVENENNWIYDSSNETVCDDTPQKACTIQVSDTFVNNPASAPTLKTSTNLSAQLHTTLGTAYVIGSADENMLITNRAD
ncbi:hypothetical protein [Pedobacter punctiformis]|uniref:Uncharacterized protein n=1 Tax=Pedobacter punctiformis TaxID=3004097 RepID=A0ABT4L777_9SPHI|nr:hypothetical protein [Pedobacter sp. HCMS5-2]MCZ4243542.1 hypothetical protein [Pedobacter sp. HCMS5-2]